MRKTTLLSLITLCLPIMAQMEKAEWISVKDAPVVTGKASKVNRAADGASWFVTTVENEKEVVSAKWTTTALPKKEPKLALFYRQWCHYYMGALEQLYDRAWNGTKGHEQL